MELLIQPLIGAGILWLAWATVTLVRLNTKIENLVTKVELLESEKRLLEAFSKK